MDRKQLRKNQNALDRQALYFGDVIRCSYAATRMCNVVQILIRYQYLLSSNIVGYFWHVWIRNFYRILFYISAFLLL